MKYLLISAFIISSLCSCAQGKYVQKVYAFNETILPGNIPVDDNGNPVHREPNIRHFIFIELPADVSPIWENATIDGRSFVVHPSVVENVPLQVGEQKSDNRMVVIKTKPGNKLWRLDLDAIDDNQNSAKNSATISNGIILKGKYKNQKINCTIPQEVELSSMPMY